MEALVKVIRKDSKLRVKINGMLDRYMILPLEYQSKIGSDCLILNLILEDLITIICTTKYDLDIELKMKISRIEYLESKKHFYM